MRASSDFAAVLYSCLSRSFTLYILSRQRKGVRSRAAMIHTHSRRFALIAFDVDASAATSSNQTLSTSYHMFCYKSSARLYAPTRDVSTSSVASSGGRYALIPPVFSLVWMFPKFVAKCCRLLAISRLSAGYFANSS